MKHWTVINENVASKLDSADTYRFACLSFTPRKNGYTDSTFKQIAAYINLNEPESEATVRKFVTRLKKSDVIKVEETRIDGNRRNKYYFPELKSKFIIIKKELLELDLPIKLKGFMIQLFSLTLNSSFDCNYSLNKIVTLIKVSKPTASKYLKELVEAGHIIKTANGYRLSREFFSIGTEKKKTKEIQEAYSKYGSSEYFKAIFAKTDWNKINQPLSYADSISGGYIGKKRAAEEPETIIYL